MATEESTTAEPTTEDSTTTESVPQPTDPIISDSIPTKEESDFPTPNETINMPTVIITDEAMMNDSTGVGVPLLIGTIAALVAVGVLITLTILISVLVCKKLSRFKTYDVGQTSLQLGVTNRLDGN